MLTIDDLGLFTDLPDFCKGCQNKFLELNEGAYYANDDIYIQSKHVTCEYVKVCTSLYERLKKQEAENEKEKQLTDLVNKIVEYMVSTGTFQTYSSNYHFEFNEINRLFGCDLPNDTDLLDKIVWEAYKRKEVIELLTDEDFDFIFGTDYCPNVEE